VKYLDLRKTMRAGVPVVIALLTLALTAGARESKASPTASQLTTLLNQFLDAAGRSDRAVFDRFFADDVIYTRSVGKTVDKSDIMKALGQREEGKSTYSADDVTIHDYGTTAVVNFRLTARTEKDGKNETSHYRNTATFLKRGGQWQVVAWQATKVPEEKPTEK
jgi:ketosteroid isomerase-like protein